MSRARRLPRHRHAPAFTKTTMPIALGGAVAAVALTASPLADALHRGRAAGSDDPDVVMVAPATATPDRATERSSRGALRPEPGPAASAALGSGVDGPSDASGSDRTGSAASGDAVHQAPEEGATAGESPSAEPSETATSGDETSAPGPRPTSVLPVPLPTLSTTHLPTLLPTLTPPPLP